MFNFLLFLFNSLLSLISSRKKLLVQNVVFKQQVAVQHRKNGKHKYNILHSDRVIFALLFGLNNIKDSLVIIKPETVLKWKSRIIKSFWTFKHRIFIGRPPTPLETRELILKMKNDNINWGVMKIQGELLKLNIQIDEKTIRNIIAYYRKRGKVKKGLSWSKFLKMQAESIFAMDFFTVDTLLNERFYILYIIHHKTREIIQYAMTKNPTTEFVRQQMIDLSEILNKKIYLIHDNGSQFILDFAHFQIDNIKTSVEAPNMNAIAERFVGSIRRECLDWYLLFNKSQIRKLIDEYIIYYNEKRPHQGISQHVPIEYPPQKRGDIQKNPILGGLHHHYYRKVA